MPDFVIKQKKKKDYEQFTCRIEADLLEKVKRTVLDYNLTSVNEFINECIKYSLKNMVIIEDDEDEKESEKFLLFTFFFWRRHPDSNRGSEFCRLVPYHLAISPYNKMERETGLKPATFALATRRSIN